MARAKNSTGTALLDDDGRMVAWKICEGRCPVCNRRFHRLCADRREQMTIDHVVASSKGGHNFQIVPMCGTCNFSKGDTDLATWLPAYLIRIKRASTIVGARRVTKKLIVRLVELQDELTSALQEAGIW